MQVFIPKSLIKHSIRFFSGFIQNIKKPTVIQGIVLLCLFFGFKDGLAQQATGPYIEQVFSSDFPQANTDRYVVYRKTDINFSPDGIYRDEGSLWATYSDEYGSALNPASIVQLNGVHQLKIFKVYSVKVDRPKDSYGSYYNGSTVTRNLGIKVQEDLQHNDYMGNYFWLDCYRATYITNYGLPYSGNPKLYRSYSDFPLNKKYELGCQYKSDLTKIYDEGLSSIYTTGVFGANVPIPGRGDILWIDVYNRRSQGVVSWNARNMDIGTRIFFFKRRYASGGYASDYVFNGTSEWVGLEIATLNNEIFIGYNLAPIANNSSIPTIIIPEREGRLDPSLSPNTNLKNWVDYVADAKIWLKDQNRDFPTLYPKEFSSDPNDRYANPLLYSIVGVSEVDAQGVGTIAGDGNVKLKLTIDAKTGVVSWSNDVPLGTYQVNILLRARTTEKEHNEVTATTTFRLNVIKNEKLISTEAQLRAMSADKDLREVVYKLANDITLVDPWTPVDFLGNFDGNYKTIKNFRLANKQGNMGFFSSFGDGLTLNEIKNLTIEVPSFTNTLDFTDDNTYGTKFIIDGVVKPSICADYGILVGRMYSGNITNVHIVPASKTDVVTVNGNIESDEAQAVVGGLVGRILNRACIVRGVSIKQSSVSVNLNTSKTFSTGGLVGRIGYTKIPATSTSTSVSTDEGGEITECYVKSDSIKSANVYLGGLGGLIGYLSGSMVIKDCFVTSNVINTEASTTGTSNAYIGGIIGKFGESVSHKGGQITDVYYGPGIVRFPSSSSSIMKTGWIGGGSDPVTAKDHYTTGNIYRLSASADIMARNSGFDGVIKNPLSYATLSDYGFSSDIWAMESQKSPRLKADIRDENVDFIDIKTEIELRSVGSSGKYRLMNNIVLTQPWVPIRRFIGQFDGNGFVISNLSFSTAGDNLKGDVGFFKEIGRATLSTPSDKDEVIVKDLVLELSATQPLKIEITLDLNDYYQPIINGVSPNTCGDFGILAGRMYSGKVMNVHVRGSIFGVNTPLSIRNNKYFSFSGGLIGRILNASKNQVAGTVLISQCSVTGIAFRALKNTAAFGGIVGGNGYGSFQAGGTINECFFSGGIAEMSSFLEASATNAGRSSDIYISDQSSFFIPNYYKTLTGATTVYENVTSSYNELQGIGGIIGWVTKNMIVESCVVDINTGGNRLPIYGNQNPVGGIVGIIYDQSGVSIKHNLYIGPNGLTDSYPPSKKWGYIVGYGVGNNTNIGDNYTFGNTNISAPNDYMYINGYTVNVIGTNIPNYASITNLTTYNGFSNDVWSFQSGKIPELKWIKDNKVDVGTILVTTEAELRAMTSTKKYRLANDIRLTSPWTPLRLFTGSFDGQGNKITNFAIANTNGNAGFFAEIGSATTSPVVKNITFVMPTSTTTVTVNQNDNTQPTYGDVVPKITSDVGIVVGRMYSGTLSNISVKKELDNSQLNIGATQWGFGGGIVGRIVTAVSQNGKAGVVIEKCVMEMNISMENIAAFGGIVGGHGYGVITGGGVIRECITQDNKMVVILVTGGIGGIMGCVRNNVTIENCLVIASRITGPTRVGGILGEAWTGEATKVDKVIFAGSLTGTEASAKIGGILGWGQLVDQSPITILNAYSFSASRGDGYDGTVILELSTQTQKDFALAFPKDIWFTDQVGVPQLLSYVDFRMTNIHKPYGNNRIYVTSLRGGSMAPVIPAPINQLDRVRIVEVNGVYFDQSNYQNDFSVNPTASGGSIAGVISWGATLPEGTYRLGVLIERFGTKMLCYVTIHATPEKAEWITIQNGDIEDANNDTKINVTDLREYVTKKIFNQKARQGGADNSYGADALFMICKISSYAESNENLSTGDNILTKGSSINWKSHLQILTPTYNEYGEKLLGMPMKIIETGGPNSAFTSLQSRIATNFNNQSGDLSLKTKLGDVFYYLVIPLRSVVARDTSRWKNIITTGLSFVRSLPRVWCADFAGDVAYHIDPNQKPGSLYPFIAFDSKVHGVALRNIADQEEMPISGRSEPWRVVPRIEKTTTTFSYYNSDANASLAVYPGAEQYVFATYQTVAAPMEKITAPDQANVPIYPKWSLTSPVDNPPVQRSSQREGLNMQYLSTWRTYRDLPTDANRFVAGLDPDEIYYINTFKNALSTPLSLILGHDAIGTSADATTHYSVGYTIRFIYADSPPSMLARLPLGADNKFVEFWKNIPPSTENPIKSMIETYRTAGHNGAVDNSSYNGFEVEENMTDDDAVQYFTKKGSGLYGTNGMKKAGGIISFNLPGWTNNTNIFLYTIKTLVNSTKSNANQCFYSAIENSKAPNAPSLSTKEIYPANGEKDFPINVISLRNSASYISEVTTTGNQYYNIYNPDSYKILFQNEGSSGEKEKTYKSVSDISSLGEITFSNPKWGYNTINLLYNDPVVNTFMDQKADSKLLSNTLVAGRELKPIGLRFFRELSLLNETRDGAYIYLERFANTKLTKDYRPAYGRFYDGYDKYYEFRVGEAVHFEIFDGDPFTFYSPEREWYISEINKVKRLKSADRAKMLHYVLSSLDNDGNIGATVVDRRNQEYFDYTFNTPGDFKLDVIYRDQSTVSHRIKVRSGTSLGKIAISPEVMQTNMATSLVNTNRMRTISSYKVSYAKFKVDSIYSRYKYVTSSLREPDRFALGKGYLENYVWELADEEGNPIITLPAYRWYVNYNHIERNENFTEPIQKILRYYPFVYAGWGPSVDGFNDNRYVGNTNTNFYNNRRSFENRVSPNMVELFSTCTSRTTEGLQDANLIEQIDYASYMYVAQQNKYLWQVLDDWMDSMFPRSKVTMFSRHYSDPRAPLFPFGISSTVQQSLLKEFNSPEVTYVLKNIFDGNIQPNNLFVDQTSNTIRPEFWQIRMPLISLTETNGWRIRTNIEDIYDMSKMFNTTNGAFTGKAPVIKQERVTFRDIDPSARELVNNLTFGKEILVSITHLEAILNYYNATYVNNETVRAATWSDYPGFLQTTNSTINQLISTRMLGLVFKNNTLAQHGVYLQVRHAKYIDDAVNKGYYYDNNNQLQFKSSSAYNGAQDATVVGPIIDRIKIDQALIDKLKSLRVPPETQIPAPPIIGLERSVDSKETTSLNISNNVVPMVQAYPNPASKSIGNVTIAYIVATENEKVTIRIYDILGREVYNSSQIKISGRYSTNVNIANYVNGMYLCRVQIGRLANSSKFFVIN